MPSALRRRSCPSLPAASSLHAFDDPIASLVRLWLLRLLVRAGQKALPAFSNHAVLLQHLGIAAVEVAELDAQQDALAPDAFDAPLPTQAQLRQWLHAA